MLVRNKNGSPNLIYLLHCGTCQTKPQYPYNILTFKKCVLWGGILRGLKEMPGGVMESTGFHILPQIFGICWNWWFLDEQCYSKIILMREGLYLTHIMMAIYSYTDYFFKPRIAFKVTSFICKDKKYNYVKFENFCSKWLLTPRFLTGNRMFNQYSLQYHRVI